jgi:hypothetical protein
VHRKNDGAIDGSLIEVVDTEGAAILIGDLDVVRRERVVGQIRKTFVGCA